MATTNSLTYLYSGNLASFNLSDLITNNIRVALLDSGYNPSMSHLNYSDLTNELSSANGYTAGGQLLSGKSITGNIFKSANPSWTASATLTAFYWVLYHDTGSKPLICYGNLNYNNGSPINLVTTAGNPLNILVASSGWLSLSYTNGAL
jgi:hypothetical protein